MDRQLIVARHGATASAGFVGHLDVALSDEGRRQATALAGTLTVLRPSLVVCSDLARAAQTGAAIAETGQVPLVLEPRLREEHLGRWQGLSHAEVARAFPAGYERWQRGDIGPFDGREGLLPVARRAVAALEALAAIAARADERLVVVTHANAATALIGRLLGLPSDRWLGLGSLSPAHWSMLRGTGRRWRLAHHNLPPD